MNTVKKPFRFGIAGAIAAGLLVTGTTPALAAEMQPQSTISETPSAAAMTDGVREPKAGHGLIYLRLLDVGVQEYALDKLPRLIVANTATGAQIDVTDQATSGVGGDGQSSRTFNVNLLPGTYTVRVQNSEGLVRFYDGTDAGTADAANAAPIVVALGKSVELAETKIDWVSGDLATEFSDVAVGHPFTREIAWMAATGITTGKKQENGSVKFDPKGDVTREAMAAFLYRLYATDAEKRAAAPTASPFADVQPGAPFYAEIAWMASSGTSTGTKQASGLPKYAPKSSITREAMAAFMYRLDGAAKPAVPATSPFTDMHADDPFYREIVWMKQSGLSTGKKQADGTYRYDPKGKTTREAMAAFLYRAEH